jgi:DNA polymerase I-like protein with 3'-5' exonuclease and polymerase domains
VYYLLLREPAMQLAIDTETTGLDMFHAARPFFITTAYFDPKGEPTTRNFHFRVDPKTREVKSDKVKLKQVREMIGDASELILHNAKFDYLMLRALDPEIEKVWDWTKVHDTVYASHVLNSQHTKDLTSLTKRYLKVDIQPYEDEVEKAVKQCRQKCRTSKTQVSDWCVAEKHGDGMPSSEKEIWRGDLWLPWEMAEFFQYPKNHIWRTALADYASADSLCTLNLWPIMKQRLEELDRYQYYEGRRRLFGIIPYMEVRGVTLNGERLESLRREYIEESTEAKAVCVSIAKDYGYKLQMPKTGRNDSLNEFVFEVMKLPVVASTESGKPALDSKVAIPAYLDTLPRRSKQRQFIDSLSETRSRDTAVSYMDSYKRFWRPVGKHTKRRDGRLVSEENFYRLHPTLNACDTSTIRFASKSPNSQNISKKKGFNLRYCFGPAPGREWWSMDYENLELRIPAYVAKEPEMMYLFEHPNEPPYFGSDHLLKAHILHPKMFEECLGCNVCGLEITTNKKEGTKRCLCHKPDPYLDGRLFKERYKSTWYSWTKNGNFAVQYGAQEASGTADRAYHMVGAQAKIQGRLGNINALNQEMIEHAAKYGYVRTIKGYPLYCGRTKFDKLRPTTPLSYFVQGTAMECTTDAMYECELLLSEWRDEGFDAFMTMQVHDELVFDLPKAAHPIEDPKNSNLSKVILLRDAMVRSGVSINVPLKVSVGYHSSNWSEEVGVKL